MSSKRSIKNKNRRLRKAVARWELGELASMKAILALLGTLFYCKAGKRLAWAKLCSMPITARYKKRAAIRAMFDEVMERGYGVTPMSAEVAPAAPKGRFSWLVSQNSFVITVKHTAINTGASQACMWIIAFLDHIEVKLVDILDVRIPEEVVEFIYTTHALCGRVPTEALDAVCRMLEESV